MIFLLLLLLLAAPVEAANIIYATAGSNETYDNSLWTVNAVTDGTITSTALANVSGPNAWEFFNPTPNVRTQDVFMSVGVVGMPANGRFVGYIYENDTIGTGANLYQFDTPNGSFTVVRNPSFGSAQQLGLIASSSGSQLGSAGGTIPTGGPWTRISVAWNITSGTTYHLKLWVNGTLAIDFNTTTGPDISGVTGTHLYWGAWHVTDVSAGNTYTYLSNMVIDDGAGLDDIGDVRATAKLSSTVTVNSFTANGTGAVNERPSSNTNYVYKSSGTSQTGQTYTIQSASSGDIDVSGSTILGYQSWIKANATTGGLGTPSIWHNGSSTGVTLTPSIATYYKTITTSSYPSSTNAVGMTSAGTTDDTFLYETGMVIVFTPGGGPPPSPVRHKVIMQ